MTGLKRREFLACGTAAAGLSLLPPSLRAEARSAGTALVGATIITMNGRDVIADGVIRIVGGRIVEVGPRSKVGIAAGDRIVDVTGKWVTPGLIDSNAHMVLTTIPEFFVRYEDQLDDIALESAQTSLKYGLTTVGDSWGPLSPLTKARDRINRGDVPGARVLVAGNIIGLGGPFTPYFMEGWDLRGTATRYGGWVHPDIQRRINAAWEVGMGPNLLALTPKEIAQAMRAYLAGGVDFVKIAVSAHGIAPTEPMMFSPAQLEAMADEVHNAGVPLQTHTFTIESLIAGIAMKPQLMQHPNLAGVTYATATPPQRAAIDQAMAAMRDQGIWAGLMMVPNRTLIEKVREWNPADHPGETAMNALMAERSARSPANLYDLQASNVIPWLKAKVPFVLATDAGPEAPKLGPLAWGKLGRAHFERMEALQALGAAPIDVLAAASINGARAYRIEKITGSIAVGKAADLLVVDADPLADVAHLRRIAMVLKDGAIVNRAALPSPKVLDDDPEAPWPY